KRPKPPAPQPVRATPAASVAAAAAPSIAVPPTTAGGDVVSSAPVAPTPDTPLQSAGFGAPVPEVPPGTVPPPVSAAAAVPPPVVVSASTLTRAGFWIRIAASFLDAIIVGLAINLLPNRWEPHFLLAFAAYCCVLWALRSTTIGGIICNLKVVRLDDRPLDWPTALVRTLGGFVSLIAVGLGFIWVAFDDQKQSWHDKIAGTTVVVVPKGVSLV
ncbi:MAG TPA: RDD family protein, partial [Opitutus sp.]|nr:RDD family protein [Opitutus sp.]